MLTYTQWKAVQGLYTNILCDCLLIAFLNSIFFMALWSGALNFHDYI